MGRHLRLAILRICYCPYDWRNQRHVPGTRTTMKGTWREKKQLFLELLPSVERNWEKCYGSDPSTGLHYPPVPHGLAQPEPWKYNLLESSLVYQSRGRVGNGSESKQSNSWYSPPFLLLNICSHIPTHIYFPNNINFTCLLFIQMKTLTLL